MLTICRWGGHRTGNTSVTFPKSYIFNYKWSPDSKKILWSEKGNTLNISDVESGNRKIVEKSGIRSMTSYNWSPDSKYITYVRPETTMDNIIVYDVESGEKHQVTDGWFGSSSPTGNTLCLFLPAHSPRRMDGRNGITCIMI